MFQESFYIINTKKKDVDMIFPFQKFFSLVKCALNVFNFFVNFNVPHKKGSMCSNHSKIFYIACTFLDFDI